MSLNLPVFIVDRIPLQFRIIKNMSDDLPRRLALALDPRKRQAALKEWTLCQDMGDFIAFASRWLGRGAIQKTSEISSAIEFVQRESPVNYCEIGTAFSGTFFLMSNLLDGLKTAIGVDLFVRNRPYIDLLHPSGQEIVLVNGSSYAPSIVRKVGDILKGRKLDILFIDGDHRYEGVRKDFLNYREYVRDGGMIMLHDILPVNYQYPGKTNSAYVGGVPILWGQLKSCYPYQEFIEDPGQDGMGIGIIHYSSKVKLPEEFCED